MALLMSAISNDGKDDRSDGNRQEHRRLPLDQDECCRRSIDSIGGGSFDLCKQHAQHQKQLRRTCWCRNVMLSIFRNWPMYATSSLQNWGNRGCNNLMKRCCVSGHFKTYGDRISECTYFGQPLPSVGTIVSVRWLDSLSRAATCLSNGSKVCQNLSSWKR